MTSPELNSKGQLITKYQVEFNLYKLKKKKPLSQEKRVYCWKGIANPNK